MHTQLLQRAAEVLGGRDELESFLKVSDTKLRMWERGIAALPPDLFLKLVDLLDRAPPCGEASSLNRKPSVPAD